MVGMIVASANVVSALLTGLVQVIFGGREKLSRLLVENLRNNEQEILSKTN
jgi:hypothetical protein